MNWILLLLILAAGTGTSLQAGVNGALGRKVGIIEAAFISFLIGTIFLSIMLLFLRKGNISLVWDVPKWQLTGGLLGAFYILTMVIAVPKIGIAASVVTLIVGQLLSSSLLDHFGVMSGKPIPIDGKRVIALVMMLVAMFLYYKK
jgi:transporter family-2 protein